MGQKLGTPHVHAHPFSPPISDSRQTKSLSPPHNKGSLIFPPPVKKKFSLLQKIRNAITSKPLHPRHFSEHDPKVKRQDSGTIPMKRSSFFSKTLEVDEVNKIQKLKHLHISTDRMNETGHSRNTLQRKKSMFDHLGISPTMSPSMSLHLSGTIPFNDPPQKIASFQTFGKRKDDAPALKRGIKVEDVEREEKRKEISKSVKKLTDNPQIKQQENKNETSRRPFDSPLIRCSKFFKQPVTNASEMLASNFGEYLNSIRGKHNNFTSGSPKNKTTTKNLIKDIKNSKDKNMNLKECEFEFPTLRTESGEKVVINDFHEMIDFFRRDKFRKDLFSNRSPPRMVGFPVGQKFDQNESGWQRAKSILRERRNRRGNINCLTLGSENNESQDCNSPLNRLNGSSSNNGLIVMDSSRVNPGSPLGNNGSKVIERNLMNKSLPPPSLLLASPMERTPISSVTKISFSPKLRAVFQEQREKIAREKDPQKKPVAIAKNNKNMIFFKNKVLQIENDMIKGELGENKWKESLLVQIMKEGSTPTKFFIKGKTGKSSSSFVGTN